MSKSRFVRTCCGVAILAALWIVTSVSPLAQSAGAAAVIVNPGVAVDDLTLAQLRDVLLGEQQHWPAGGPRIAVFRPDTGAEWDITLSRVLRMSALGYTRRLSAKRYGGELTVQPRVVRTAAERVRLVAATAGALAIIPASAADSTVKVLRIDGRLPADDGYAMTMP